MSTTIRPAQLETRRQAWQAVSQAESIVMKCGRFYRELADRYRDKPWAELESGEWVRRSRREVKSSLGVCALVGDEQMDRLVGDALGALEEAAGIRLTQSESEAAGRSWVPDITADRLEERSEAYFAAARLLNFACQRAGWLAIEGTPLDERMPGSGGEADSEPIVTSKRGRPPIPEEHGRTLVNVVNRHGGRSALKDESALLDVGRELDEKGIPPPNTRNWNGRCWALQCRDDPVIARKAIEARFKAIEGTSQPPRKIRP